MLTINRDIDKKSPINIDLIRDFFNIGNKSRLIGSFFSDNDNNRGFEKNRQSIAIHRRFRYIATKVQHNQYFI